MKILTVLLLTVIAVAFVGWRVARLARPALAPESAMRLSARPVPTPPAGATPSARTAGAANASADAASSAVASCIELLSSPKTSFADRGKLWGQLRLAGRLDEAVAVLKKLQQSSPGDAAIALAAGEGERNQERQLFESQAPFTEIALLALKADKDFDASLALNPASWDAQYEKAEGLFWWPPFMNKGSEVIDRLTSLISQQASETPRPEFANSYAVLGQQYQKSGETDRAIQTWQQGLAAYPLDADLQQRLAHASAP